ncbi:outer membrane beta-barrel protein [Granulicella sp. 5B5]|uniref:outer membrane beta-barrel protein n=1 Tax=Granulicella sp. 5B5 TaxID=1617967 RepID=UPI0015F6F917|nr:outer membrane beta-barrel protein [Granulicella sp. 5B5]QMV18055.1 outer membrane beta-barrel protein [Granulicella sp. 5B5]
MKKMMLLGALLVCAAGVGHAQESRQDASLSFMGVYANDVYGLTVEPMHTTSTGGILASYRYDLTPRSQLELNYSWAQNSILYHSASFPVGEVHTRQQEITGAYVYTRSYHNWNPFLEAGVGGYIFTPILDSGTHQSPSKQNTNIGALFGGGVAYEISPSFDVRVQYRGFLMKTPDFGQAQAGFKTNRYYVLMTPALGIAYHF